MMPPWPSYSRYSFLCLARLVDTYIGLIFSTPLSLPYVIWMMRGYIEDIPLELERVP